MTATASVGVIVAAAGRGARFASAENKIWTTLLGRTSLDWSLSAFQSHDLVRWIVVVAAQEELDRIRAACSHLDKLHAVAVGGATRSESVYAGLAALPAECEVVLVHDAARPAVTASLITRVIEKTQLAGAAVPGLPISDTVKRADDAGQVQQTVSRDGLWTVQTPQGARVEQLRAAYSRLGRRAALATDEAAVLQEAAVPVAIVEGDPNNIKITAPGDDLRAEWAMASAGLAPAPNRQIAGAAPQAAVSADPGISTVRTGIGYDVHRFQEGRPLWLGGVRIPHGRGLIGHSDADVVLHAVCDALLGAASMGDIGALFPDSDPAHKDRASMEFIREVADRLQAESWRIANIDVSVLAEEPRIGPYRSAMCATIADGLSIEPTQVNLKATTNEGMGYVGRGEGIACWAVATLVRR